MKNEKSTTSVNTGKIIVAALGGALVGAALGVLFAPDKGSVTRSKIAGGVKKMGKGIKNQVEELNNSDSEA